MAVALVVVAEQTGNQGLIPEEMAVRMAVRLGLRVQTEPLVVAQFVLSGPVTRAHSHQRMLEHHK